MAAPTELSGAGFTPLHVIASSGYVIHFIKNWRTETEQLGKTIRICYAWSQANACVSFSLLSNPEIEVSHLRGTVVSAIWSYLAIIDGKITLDCSYIRPKLRVNDVCIMDLAIRMDFTDNQRNRINAVREWYNVMYLSEITNKSGKTIMDGVLFVLNTLQKYRRCSDGPIQKKPNSYSFKFWQKTATTIVTQWAW